MLKFEKRINYLLHIKYKTNRNIVLINIVDNIIFNEKCHLVSKFKDFLIFDDDYEFLKRYYNNEESIIRLKKFFTYYNKYSMLFPNYSVLSESGIIYKNINLKQKLLDDLHTNNKIKDTKNDNENKKENIDSMVFNSKVYESIIKDSDNCLSLFSYDKESNCTDYKDEGINEIIENIEINDKIKMTQAPPTRNNIIFQKKLNFHNIKNKIYTKKKTVNSVFNSKHVNDSSNNLTKSLKSQIKAENNEISNNNNQAKTEKNNIKKSNNSFLINQKIGIYKRINLHFSTEKNSKRSSLSLKNISRGHSKINTPNTNKNNNKISMNITSIKEEYNGKNKNEFYKIKGMPIKINLLNEQLKLPRIKVNMKKINDIRNQKAKINKKIIININKFNEFTSNPKNINNNSFCNKTYNNLNNNIINNISINNDNKNKNLYLRNINEELIYNKNNSFKGRKINLTKNKDQYQQLNYIINNYDNKLSTYNTSIQFNNNNINIINSSDNRNNIIYNIYKTTTFNQSNNISDYLPNTPYEKKLINEFKSYNGLKKNCKKLQFLLNKKNYFSTINDNKRKQHFSKKLIFNSNAKTNYLDNSNSKYNTTYNGLNSERLSTPFNLWKNNKLYPKNTLRINNDSIEKKYKTLTNNVIKKYKKGFKMKEMNYTKNNSIRNSSLKNKILNMTNKSLTKSTAEKDNSFIKSKMLNKMFQNFSYIKKEYKIINDKDEKNYTNFTSNSNTNREYFVKKIFKKTHDQIKNIKEFKDRRIKRIITESNEEIDKIKNEFLKKLENQMTKKKNKNN